MIRRHALRTSAIVTLSAAAPGAAAVLAALDGAPAVTSATITIGVAAISAAIGVALLRSLWRPIQTELDAATQLLNDADSRTNASNPADTTFDPHTLPALVHAALSRHQRELATNHDRIHRLGLIIESLGEPVLAVDEVMTIVFANTMASDFLQLDSSRLIGVTASQVITQAALLMAIEHGLAGEHHTARIDLATHRGTRTYDLVCAPLAVDEQSTGAILILRDVTDLARAARMKTDFVANASHELRTPLAAIRAALDTARLAANDDPKLMRKFIDMTPAHLNKIEEMTRDLIDLSRLENPDHQVLAQPLATNELRNSLTSLFQEQANHRPATLDFELAPSLDGFSTDPRLVHLALKNLIDNALKFCNADSTVHVAGDLAETKDQQRWARFEVRNDGVGVPLDQQERIFERFFQIDAAKLSGTTSNVNRSGTGLGLSIVKHALGALAGDLGVDSVYLQGATFWFTIPEIPDVTHP